MTRRARVQWAIARRKDALDRFPHQIDFTWRMRKQVAEMTGVPEEELPFLLDNHIFYIDTHKKVRRDEEKGVDYDLFGVGWDIVRSEGYLPVEHPLDTWSKWEKYHFPDPASPVLYCCLLYTSPSP
ncbi:MAG: hypothetical protein N2205_01365, partial [Candidatus Caldatribacterium sp.]|nr:hypothetical protein [Candidatus Caldatribacterium sp.]